MNKWLPIVVGVPLGIVFSVMFGLFAGGANRAPDERFIVGDLYLCSAYWDYRKAGYEAAPGMEDFCRNVGAR